MTTVTIKNVPVDIIKKFWATIDYKEVDVNFTPKKRINSKASKLIKEWKSPSNTSSWPFEVSEFINIMKGWQNWTHSQLY
ncbi:MAG: hypothetical protein ACD_49C00086G0002 [uncultured bacterium (gcode 4)]|uniref:Uncharacterized protein n=1 Tax=uncultured bacterium (gcode 4) TaxID=1234023 RepID=K2AVU1_9BACT|nr:MAG: hypothetical protein ACD_49C00086G0002 [uncultured bacterium (gcode 4)]